MERHSNRSALQRTGCGFVGSAAECAGWDGGQVSGTGGGGRDLFADDIVARGCTARYGIFVQSKSAECGDIACDVDCDFGGKPQTNGTGVQKSKADAVSERSMSVLRVGYNAHKSFIVISSCKATLIRERKRCSQFLRIEHTLLHALGYNHILYSLDDNQRVIW